MLIGYARTSTIEQVAGLEAQEVALAATGCTKLFAEQASSVAQRDQLAAALEWVRDGDCLVVTRLDRLARSTADLLGIVALLERKQVGLRVLDFGGSEVDTRSPTGRMLLTMFAAVAEFERAIMLERQRAGVARARAEGKYRGRVPTARRQGKRVVALHASGLGATAIVDVIRRRLDTLPMATRAVFLLLRFDALDYGQIAWRLGIEKVERHVARAMLVLTWGTDEERAETQPRE